MSSNFDLTGKRVWVAGHRGMVGSAIVRRLADMDCEVLTAGRKDADLRRQAEVEAWMADTKPEAIFLAAATVGGIHANDTRPAEFLYDNLMIEGHVIEAAHRRGTEKLMLLGSSCIYPRLAKQPMDEAQLLTGPLEPTNQWYAVAKIAGIKLCQAYRKQHGSDFISVMPTNLYGPGDNFDLAQSHVIPALLRKAHEAKQAGAPNLTVWGSGTPMREFLHVDDMADACVYLMQHYSGHEHVNVGTGEDVTIAELARLVTQTVQFGGDLVFDADKPDGTPRKLLDVSRLHGLGWQHSIGLEEGLAQTYQWFLDNHEDARLSVAVGV
ncbi:MAG: GDP-L-fucose synthase [Pseudomonadota bacterium]